jgi:hypothetical protein
MNNKAIFGYVAMVFVAALLTTVATVPLRYAAAQNATFQNATTSQTDESMKENMIKYLQIFSVIAQLKAEHPVLASILNTIHSMNATQTLAAIIGLNALERILDAHALNIVLHKLAAMRNFTG